MVPQELFRIFVVGFKSIGVAPPWVVLAWAVFWDGKVRDIGPFSFLVFGGGSHSDFHVQVILDVLIMAAFDMG